MAKLTTSEVYDKSEIAGTNSFSELESFIDYQSDFATDVIQSYFNGITINENLKQSTYNLSVQHGTAITIPLTSYYTISGIKSIVPIRSYSISRTLTNTVSLTIYFDQPVNVLSNQAIWQSGNITRYRLVSGATSVLKLGDFITISGFGTANNNGTFQVIDIDNTGNYVYVINRLRTSATGDESRTTLAGDVNEKVSITISFVA